MAISHLGWSQMANGGILRPVMLPGLKSPPWSTHQIQSYCIDQFLLSYRCTNVLMYRFAKVTIYLGVAFIATIFDIFKFIIDYQVDHQI